MTRQKVAVLFGGRSGEHEVSVRSASSVARDMGLRRGEIEDDLRHALRSAAAAGHRIEIIPARCKDCGFTFGTDRLLKPGRCPACKGSRLFEALMRIAE